MAPVPSVEVEMSLLTVALNSVLKKHPEVAQALREAEEDILSKLPGENQAHARWMLDMMLKGVA